MSDITNFLSNVFGQGWLKDQQHARALYRDDNLYDLAPKAGWLYYIKLGINPAIREKLDKTWAGRFSPIVGVLAKSADLPRYKISTETVNQYNRKTKVHSKLDYEPVTITFHDDMANATTNLWRNYYNYYFADGAAGISAAYKNSKSVPKFSDTKYGISGYNYGLANGSTDPFFTDITIYLLNKKRFAGLTLLNPIITDWSHSSVDQSSGNKMMENKMTIAYESVIYSSGRANKTGFTNNHYDNSPSPLVISGALGLQGVIADGSNLLGDFQDVSLSSDPLELAGIALRTANLAKNVSKLTAAQVKQEGYSILVGQLGNLGRLGGSSYLSSLGLTTGGASPAGAQANLFKQFKNPSVADATPASSGSVPANNTPPAP
jgi:hypothetical protein